jgi:phage major head subunit gpT-like protein
MGASGLGSRGIIGEFYHQLSLVTGSGWINMLGWLNPDSDQESETYKWLGQVPQMREWIGGRQAKGLSEQGYTIKNVKFESTLKVSVDDLRRDKTGQIMLRIRELAKRTNTHWAQLMSALIVAGAATNCYDGQYFFDNDHSEGGSGTQINAVTADHISALNVSTATAPTTAEMAEAIINTIAYMMTYVDNEGEPLNEDAKQFLIMCPTYPIWLATRKAVGLGVITDGSGAYDNVVGALDDFKIQVVMNPRLRTLTTNFFTFRTDGDMKPFILQEELPVQMSAIAEGSELEFQEDEHHYGVKAIRNAGYGFWQSAIQATLS